MFVYDLDKKFEWKSPSWTPDTNLYSEWFNNLLVSGKSVLTALDIINFNDNSPLKINTTPLFEKIEKNRAKLIAEYKPIFEKFKNEPVKKLDDANYTAYVYYQKYIEDKNGGGLEQFAKDAFPMEALLIARY